MHRLRADQFWQADGLKVILSATIVVSLPLLLVGVLMCLSLLRLLRGDFANQG